MQYCLGFLLDGFRHSIGRFGSFFILQYDRPFDFKKSEIPWLRKSSKWREPFLEKKQSRAIELAESQIRHFVPGED